jgi:outer membrane protein assembly factor BamB
MNIRQKYPTVPAWLIIAIVAIMPASCSRAKHPPASATNQSSQPALTQLWRFKTDGPVKSSPTIAGGKVYVGSDDGNIYAINLADGSRAWSFKTGDAVQARPIVAGGRVIVGSGDESLYCLDAASGQLQWQYKTGGKIVGSACVLTAQDGSGEGEKGERILVGSYDNKMHCLAGSDGKPLWAHATTSPINGSAAIADGQVIFGGCDKAIHILNAADGVEIARIDTGAILAASPVVSGKKAYIGNLGKQFLCLNLETRKLDWTFKGPAGEIHSTAALANGFIVFGCRDNRVYCLDRKTGEKIWAFAARDCVDSSPTIADSRVVVGCDDGTLYELNLADGKMLRSFEIGQPIASSPAVSGEVIVVGCDDGWVYALK